MSPPGNDRRIDYVELAVSDIARARDFYGKAFGWTFKDYGPDYCEFNDGRLTGGFAKAGAVTPGAGPLVILYADDLEDMQRRIESAGAASPSRSSASPAAGASISSIPTATSSPSGPPSSTLQDASDFGNSSQDRMSAMAGQQSPAMSPTAESVKGAAGLSPIEVSCLEAGGPA